MAKNTVVRLALFGVCIVASFVWAIRISYAATASSLTGNVICGYQGWFAAPNDSINYGSWEHWTIDTNTPTSNNMNIDFWPDMSYFQGCPQYNAGNFKNPGGSQTTLYSAADAASVNAQFNLMKNDGIDGVAVQRFTVALSQPNGSGGWTTGNKLISTSVINNVENAAAANGRIWCVEYDITGQSPSTVVSVIQHDWTNLVNSGYTNSTGYLHQNGLPVVMVFGFFYNDNSHPADYPDSANSQGAQLINWLHAAGSTKAYCVASGEWYWYNDAASEPNFASLMKMPDAVQGWEAGNYPPTGNYSPEASWCAANNQMWLPEIYPGIDNFNEGRGITSMIDRQGGAFLWSQFYQASTYGIQAAYVGMWDEVNEGTQIEPCTSSLPSATPAPNWWPNNPPWWSANPDNSEFNTYYGIPKGAGSDYYVKMTAALSRLVDTHTPVPQTNSFLVGNQTLNSGASITAGGYTLVMQASDGNLVLSNPSGQKTWSSNTAGNPGAVLNMQSDGNLVLYTTGGKPIWASNTSGNSGAYCILQATGDLQVLGAAGNLLWHAGSSATLPSNTVLASGQAINSSGWVLSMQASDGNLVITNTSGQRVWASNTAGNPGALLNMQSDGNLVIYSAAGKALWNSNTGGNNGAYCVLQPNGDLQVMSLTGTLLWHTGT